VAATLEGCAAAVTGGPSGACFAAGSAGKGITDARRRLMHRTGRCRR